jgi:hypothetical protein
MKFIIHSEEFHGPNIDMLDRHALFGLADSRLVNQRYLRP